MWDAGSCSAHLIMPFLNKLQRPHCPSMTRLLLYEFQSKYITDIITLVKVIKCIHEYFALWHTLNGEKFDSKCVFSENICFFFWSDSVTAALRSACGLRNLCVLSAGLICTSGL